MAPPLDTRPDWLRVLSSIEVDVAGCWIWQQATWRNGYGRFRVGHGRKGFRTVGAHRASYEAFVGPIPDGLELDHLCRVRCCVNPAHLEPVTHAENRARAAGLKTHCPAGHAYEGTNIIDSPGGRKCRACVNERQRLDYSRKKATA